MPSAATIDISAGGALLVFAVPVGLTVGERVVVSMALGDSRFHCLGRVARTARGSDHRSYVAIAFDLDDDQRDELSRRLDTFDAAADDEAARRARQWADEAATPSISRTADRG